MVSHTARALVGLRGGVLTTYAHTAWTDARSVCTSQPYCSNFNEFLHCR